MKSFPRMLSFLQFPINRCDGLFFSLVFHKTIEKCGGLWYTYGWSYIIIRKTKSPGIGFSPGKEGRVERQNSEDNQTYMDLILAHVRQHANISETAFELWFSDLRLLQIDTDRILLATGDELKRKVLANRYAELIRAGVEETLGYAPAIDIICDKGRERTSSTPLYEEPTLSVDATSDAERGDEAAADTDAAEEVHFPSDSILPGYTFENYVVGGSNAFVHACCTRVAENPGATFEYNPLFIYGPSGLGKTHLMYAIANRVRELHPEKKIVCVKCEDFMNELIRAISKTRTAQFREKYRKVDLLLIDDIQMISGKESTQLEFFHTFDALYESGKQIVVTSDRPPREMYTLVDRIKTRFLAGMIADVQPPEYELRLAILEKKAEHGNIVVPGSVLKFLAERLDSNVREIEGALKKIGAVSLITGRPITLEMVKSSIPEYFRENKSVSETVDNVLNVTARKYDVTVEDILGKARTKDIRTARNVSMYVIRTVLNMSFPSIGKMFNRDPATVLSNIRTVEKEMETDHRLHNEIMEIFSEIKS